MFVCQSVFTHPLHSIYLQRQCDLLADIQIFDCDQLQWQKYPFTPNQRHQFGMVVASDGMVGMLYHHNPTSHSIIYFSPHQSFCFLFQLFLEGWTSIEQLMFSVLSCSLQKDLIGLIAIILRCGDSLGRQLDMVIQCVFVRMIKLLCLVAMIARELSWRSCGYWMPMFWHHATSSAIEERYGPKLIQKHTTLNQNPRQLQALPIWMARSSCLVRLFDLEEKWICLTWPLTNRRDRLLAAKNPSNRTVESIHSIRQWN